MKKFLACANTNGTQAALDKIFEIAAQRKPDAILSDGGIVDQKSNKAEKVRYMGEFFKCLGKTDVYSFISFPVHMIPRSRNMPAPR